MIPAIEQTGSVPSLQPPRGRRINDKERREVKVSIGASGRQEMESIKGRGEQKGVGLDSLGYGLVKAVRVLRKSNK